MYFNSLTCFIKFFFILLLGACYTLINFIYNNCSIKFDKHSAADTIMFIVEFFYRMAILSLLNAILNCLLFTVITLDLIASCTTICNDKCD